MIACIRISKLHVSHYIVHVDDTEAGVAYASIAEGIADHVDIPPEYAKFVNIEYHDIRLATMAVTSMRSHARDLAAELIRMNAEIHASE